MKEHNKENKEEISKKLIGEGNSGTIYELDGEIAKKVFKNKKFYDAELQILEKTKGLNHVIKVKKISKQDNTIYMEYIPYNLEKIITGKYPKKLHQFDKNKIVTELLSGLKSLHSRNIIHNDFKAKNIQVTENSDIKIIDFDSSDFNLKSLPKRIEDVNKAKIIILQMIHKRTYPHTFKTRCDYVNKIEDKRFREIMEFDRYNLNELLNYVKKMNL